MIVTCFSMDTAFSTKNLEQKNEQRFKANKLQLKVKKIKCALFNKTFSKNYRPLKFLYLKTE